MTIYNCPSVYNGGYNNSSDSNKEVYDFCVNGGFEIWQKGTNFEIGSENAITADMWRVNSVNILDDSSPVKFLVSKDFDSPNYKTDYCVKIQPKTSLNVLSGDIEGHIRQGIDGIRFKSIFGRNLVCSFWVKSNKPGIYSIAAVNYALTKSYIKEYEIFNPDTWEYKELVFPFIGLDENDWEFGNAGAVRFRFELYNNGSLVAPSNDTWLSGNYCGSVNQVNFAESDTNYFKLTQVKFEVNENNEATDYKRKSYTNELLECQRFYQLVCLSIDINASAINQYFSFEMPLYTPLIKSPVVSIVNDCTSRQPTGGFSVTYPGVDVNASKDVITAPITFIPVTVNTTSKNNDLYNVRVRFISTGSGRNAITDFLVELDATI